MASNVVVVESPAKAETINKYLGNDYAVIASYGHVRDLPPKDGSVNPDDNFRMMWSLEARGKKRVDDIAKLVKKANTVLLATDPDREGEAISWHVYEVLKDYGLLDNKEVRRVVFNEITKTAIKKAMENPREINQPLVDAYMARRALDYLVGFNLSPVLWRKLPGSRSAGRVQSVALRLICERESEIEAFKTDEYWTIEATFKTPKGELVTANLSEALGKKLAKLDIQNEATAQSIVSATLAGSFSVGSIDPKTTRRNPYPPFITSTLQQGAAQRLGFSVSRTMSVAQSLYEGVNLGHEGKVGLITYMRTDGVNLAAEAVQSIRQCIEQSYGPKYLPDSPRMYKSKSKNAQEAHEAIRPTDVFRHPDKVRPYLSEDQAKLYDLIWRRTMACQMAQAVLDQLSVELVHPGQKAEDWLVYRATGSVLVFDGFYRLYHELQDSPNSKADAKEKEDDTDEEEKKKQASDRRLPPMTLGEAMKQDEVLPEQHFTKPPPRFSEASLVKAMEELGIGRPSTYASIIRILQDRNYVRMESRRFIPEDRGRLVTTFLTHFFKRYVEYDFTAQLEEQLDDISDNKLDSLRVLNEFWSSFKEAVGQTKDLTITQVLDVLDEELGDHFFPVPEDGSDPRQCPGCKEGRLSIKIGRFGAFIGCSEYPGCKYTRQLKMGEGDADGDEALASGPAALGQDPVSGKTVYLNKGPYGYYVQLGTAEEAQEEADAKASATATAKPAKTTKSKAGAEKAAKPKKAKKAKPKMSSLMPGMVPSQVTLDQAISLLSLPRELGVFPDTGETIMAGLGRFGPYVKFGETFVSLKKEDNVLTVDVDRAIELIRLSGKKTINLGDYKKKPVKVQKGRFGYYISYNKLSVALPKGTDPDTVTYEDAVERIEAKLAKEEAGGTAKGATGKGAKKAAPKTAAKSTTKAKTAAKKKTTSKKAAAKA